MLSTPASSESPTKKHKEPFQPDISAALALMCESEQTDEPPRASTSLLAEPAPVAALADPLAELGNALTPSPKKRTLSDGPVSGAKHHPRILNKKPYKRYTNIQKQRYKQSFQLESF